MHMQGMATIFIGLPFIAIYTLTSNDIVPGYHVIQDSSILHLDDGLTLPLEHRPSTTSARLSLHTEQLLEFLELLDSTLLGKLLPCGIAQFLEVR